MVYHWKLVLNIMYSRTVNYCGNYSYRFFLIPPKIGLLVVNVFKNMFL